jgi:hypothetical protein
MDVPWRDEDLLNYVREAIQNGPKNKRRCTKLSGAATTDALRLGLRTHGIRTSERDVYVKGMSTEIDLIVPRMACDTCGRTVYDAAEVLVAFEVKKRGISDKGGLTKIRCDFSAYSAACGGAKCMYVTLTETPWTGRATFENLGHPAYTLFFEKGSGRKLRFDSTGDWERLLCDLHSLVGAVQ